MMPAKVMPSARSSQRQRSQRTRKPENTEAGELSENVGDICGAVAKVGEDSEYEDEQEAVERKCSP